MAEPYKIELKDVHKSFGPKKVLNGVNLEVQTGTSLVIIGGSGTGKSVTIKCILGLLRPDKGRIFVDGEEVTRASGRRREEINTRIGMLFQGAALFDSLRRRPDARVTSSPSTSTRPLSGRSSPRMHLMVTDFPVPEPPMMTSEVPVGT